MNIRNKEQRILVVMRKLLAQIVKDTTPGPGMRHPLNEQTIKDMVERWESFKRSTNTK